MNGDEKRARARRKLKFAGFLMMVTGIAGLGFGMTAMEVRPGLLLGGFAIFAACLIAAFLVNSSLIDTETPEEGHLRRQGGGPESGGF